jgi:hypothetical protein
MALMIAVGKKFSKKEEVKMKNIIEEKKMRKLVFVFILFIFFNLLIFGDTFYKISGKVVHNGAGVEDINLRIYKVDTENDLREDYALFDNTQSDINGDFHFFVKNGIYKVIYGRRAQKGYVADSNFKTIEVKNKNISNVIFFLTKECKISGVVKFEDNTPVTAGSVHYSNDKGSWSGDINNNGEYIISGIKKGENGDLYFTPDGMSQKDIYDIVLNEEGAELKNINLILPKKKSISGKVVDKTDGKIIKDFVIILQNLNTEEQIRFDKNSDNGDFVFYNLKKGKYALFCEAVAIESKEGDIFFKPKEIIINLQDGQTKEIVVELEKN